MCFEHRNLTWTLMLLFLPGALCSQWKVEYEQQHICAVKGSSVVIRCSFYYPDKQRVTKVMWGHERSNIYDGPFIFDSEVNNNSSRFQYIGDKRHNCSLKIQQVEREDTGKHAFRFITDKNDKWTGPYGSTLQVVDLKISVTKPNGDGATKEGDSVNLICRNSCDVGHLSSAFTWFKNEEPINEGPVLYLSNMTSANSGNYTCSLQKQPGTTSGVINIDVEYGPKNTSASVRPSMEVDAGSNITLICSSHANPPVENYTWFKIDHDDIMDVGHQAVLFSGDGGQFFCSASNKHGSQNSSVVTVKIKENKKHKNVLIVTYCLLTVAVLLIVTAVIVIRRLNKKRTRATETDSEDDTQNREYVNWPQEEGKAVELIYATVDIRTKRKSNMEEQMDSPHDDEGVIYSTVCRNPSYAEPL